VPIHGYLFLKIGMSAQNERKRDFAGKLFDAMDEKRRFVKFRRY